MADLKSISESSNYDIRKNLQALSNLPRFLKEIYQVNPSLFLANIFSRVLAALLPLALLWVGKLIVDSVISEINKEMSLRSIYNVLPLLIVEVALIFGQDLLNRWISLSDGLMGDQYSLKSSILLINKTASVEIEQLENSEFYDKLERARQQTAGRVFLLSNALGLLQDIVVITTLVASLIFFEPWLLILLFISIIPAFLNEVKFSNNSYSLSKSWTSERRELDYLRFIGANDKTAKEIKLFGLAEYISTRFKNLSVQYYEANKKLSTKRALYGFAFNTLGTLSYYSAYVYIITMVLKGKLSLGGMTFLAGSFDKLKTKMESSFARFTKITENALYLKDYYDFIDIKEPPQLESILPLPKDIKQGFQFEDVHFAYPDTDHEVISGISFSIRKGEKLALVGVNGAGKTTLIKLVLRFYEPTKGRILLDGIDIKRFEKSSYQKLFGVIFQDFVKYEFNVKENIAVGNISQLHNNTKIEAAAQASLASEVISTLRDGLNQQLGKRFSKGIELSGGQWQKIALARAYMKDAEILILDEPTSALDARAEFEAFQRFIGLTENKTAIIISHRFSTVRTADNIIVLKNGLIAEQGNHKTLIDLNGIYSELFELQAAGYN